jgi:signal transduction histidine kinase
LIREEENVFLFAPVNTRNNRILIVDDNRSIHEDFRKILAEKRRDLGLAEAEALFFGQRGIEPLRFDLTFATQGEEAVALTTEARIAGRPFALVFMDVRMPPGMDGITAAARLWEIDADLQIVICSAFSDYSWADMTAQLGSTDRWVILKKPFDNIEVLQFAHALTEKWALRQQTKLQVLELEQRVAARTADLQSALERLQRESAERIRAEEERRAFERKFEETQRLESLGVLAGGIAHDFNNILTGILGSASLARLDAASGSELDEHLQRIEKNSCRAAELCEQMLAYAGKGQVTLRPLDLNALVRETLELLQASVPKDAVFNVRLAPVLPSICGDAARTRQVIMNLVINASEALAQGPRQLTLSTQSIMLSENAIAGLTFAGGAVSGDYACIEVTDTGIGMSQETLRRIFEPFYTTKFTGRGLGLCAVQGIIRSRGGALHVTSELGKGTTFRVYFPAVGARHSTPTASPFATRTPAAQHLGTILVVDDEEGIRDISAAALRRQGFEVLTSANGAEAVALVKKSREPLVGILLDLTMPELDGVATLQAVRALRPDLRAILMSGYEQREALRRFEGLGLSGFLQKPFTMDALGETTRSLLGATRVL